MSEETTAQIRREGDLAFPEDTENDNSPDLPSVDETDSDEKETNDDPTQLREGEQTPADNTEDVEKNPSFHEHPAWKEREEEWKGRFNEQEERHTQELQELRETFEKRFDEIGPKKAADNTPSEIPAWFGGDEQQWEQFRAWNAGLVKEAEQNIRSSLAQETEKQDKAIAEATKYLNSEIAAIETDSDLNPTGGKVDRNKLLKYVMENELVDTKGRWNYRAGYRLLKAEEARQSKDTRQEKKALASATSSERRAETKPSSVKTSDDFANPTNRPW